MKISFVIPCYNAEKNISKVVNSIFETMATRSDLEYEIILVNDGSKDKTKDIITSLAHSYQQVIAIDLAKNMGQHNALMAGFNHVTGDYIMTSDDDGQTPVERVFDFLEELEKGFDVVCGRYTQRHKRTLFRRLGSRVNQFVSDWLIKKPKHVYVSIFFMARAFVIKEITRYTHPYPYMSGLLLRTTHNIGNVDIEQLERETGASGYTISKLLSLWLNGFTAFSMRPIRVIAGLGVIIAFIGITLLGIFLSRSITSEKMAIGNLLTPIVVFLFGMLFLSLGLIGEYIGRIYISISKSPQYVIREITEKNQTRCDR